MPPTETPGALSPLENAEFEGLLIVLNEWYGYDFRNYNRPTLRRRIRNAIRDERVASISALQDLVLRDPAAMNRLVATISVHVSSMFRDPEFYRAFRVHAIPVLRTYPFIRIWHAGCATGEEVYSMAALLASEGLYDRCRLYATDMSELVLERARRAIFPTPTVVRGMLNYQRSGGERDLSLYYVANSDHVVFRQELRRNIIFSHHNLACDGVFNDFHVVLCRNVMLYFDAVLRERVYGLLDSSLVRRGILGLGLKESLDYASIRDGYEEFDGVRLYRKVAA